MGHWDDAYEEKYNESFYREKEQIETTKAEEYKKRLISELSTDEKVEIMFQQFLKNMKANEIIKLGETKI